ncbi:unannotated protein [freshwater metagenome]|uniref:Unannotated protein n=1 Tax=freshwater metagenome TaxID=449393 RepID=A0A6J7I452_9ZZZZ
MWPNTNRGEHGWSGWLFMAIRWQSSTPVARTAKTAVTAVALAAGCWAPIPAAADPTPQTVGNALLATTGGCRAPAREAVQACTAQEVVTSAAPVVLDVLDPARVPVVVLGAGLYPDGSIRPVLDARLRAAKTIADRYPTAPLIVSGGVPRSGVTEGAAMTRWLTSHGVPPDRISTEQTSTSTASNAACVAPMLAAMNAYAAVVVTTADHLPRALVEFRLATGGARPIFGAAAL